MKLILFLVALLYCALLIDALYRHSNVRKDRNRNKRIHGYESSTNEQRRGKKQSSRFNSTRSNESSNSEWDANGRKTKSHTKQHHNSASNYDQNEEEYNSNSNSHQWSPKKRTPWQKPTNGNELPKKGKNPNKNSQNGFGQGFEPKKPHSGYNPFEHQPRPFNSTKGDKTPNENSQNGFGQGFEPKKPHSGYNPFEHQPRPFNSTDSGQLGQQPETAQPTVNQNERPTTAVPKTLPRKKGNKGKNGRSKCRPFAGRVPNCNWNGGSPHGPGPMKVPNGDKNGNRTPDQNNDQTSPNEDNPNTDNAQPESEKGLGDNEVEDSEEPGTFNPGLFCQMNRREKCHQLEQELCTGESKSERQSDCLRSMCSDRQTRCAMAKSMAIGCNKTPTLSSKYREMCA